MTDQDLDQSYSALCQALGRVGQAQAPMFLSMLCLSLISRMDDAGQVLALIGHAQGLCRGDGDGTCDGRQANPPWPVVRDC